MKTEKISAMIVEDNHDALRLLQKHLEKYPEIELSATAGTVDQATLAFLKHRPSLIFLDVELGDHTGFEFLENIREITDDLTVIFTTAYDHYAMEAIKHSAFDYLLKPIDPAELAVSLEKYRKQRFAETFREKVDYLHRNLDETHHLKLTVKHGFIWLNTSDILYCQAEWNYTQIFMCDGSHHMVTLNIGKLENQLPAGTFLRANRSLIINLKYLKQVDKDKGICILKNRKNEIALKLSTLTIRKLEKLLEKRISAQ